MENPIGWDTNLLTLDGYDEKTTYRVSLKEIYTIHREYELKRKMVGESTQKTKLKTFKRLMRKYSRRERNRVENKPHNTAKSLVNRSHIFEDLTYMKRNCESKSKKKNRQLFKSDLTKLQRMMEYKANWDEYNVIYVNPKNTSKTCSRCGYVVKTLIEAVFKYPSCGQVTDRQENASVNIYKRGLGIWVFGGLP